MELWWAYDFLSLMIANYMRQTDHCLYNALVIKMSRQPADYLLKVRDSLRNVATMIDQELANRQTRNASRD